MKVTVLHRTRKKMCQKNVHDRTIHAGKTKNNTIASESKQKVRPRNTSQLKQKRRETLPVTHFKRKHFPPVATTSCGTLNQRSKKTHKYLARSAVTAHNCMAPSQLKNPSPAPAPTRNARNP